MTQAVLEDKKTEKASEWYAWYAEELTAFAPPVQLKPSEWAETYRYLPRSQ